MENIDYINQLNESNITLITDYLIDNYEILHDTFVNKVTKKSEWTHSIIKELILIYTIEEDFVSKTIRSWSVNNGMGEDKWDRNFLSQGLKYIVKPTMQADLERLIGIGVNAEKQMITIIINEILKEVDSPILKELKKKITTFAEFENLLKCLGYKVATVFSADTFEPLRRIITITEYDKMYEQQNNTYWKDWFRARRPNQEA